MPFTTKIIALVKSVQGITNYSSIKLVYMFYSTAGKGSQRCTMFSVAL